MHLDALGGLPFFVHLIHFVGHRTRLARTKRLSTLAPWSHIVKLLNNHGGRWQITTLDRVQFRCGYVQCTYRAGYAA
jgi:hypothetical protein